MQRRQYVQGSKRCKCGPHASRCTCAVDAQQEAAAALGYLIDVWRCAAVHEKGMLQMPRPRAQRCKSVLWGTM